jgi:hypothetical protein
MAVTVDDVKMWLMLHGMGHVVASTNDYWIFTACRIYTPNGALTPKKPKRICLLCRQMLAMASVTDDKI